MGTAVGWPDTVKDERPPTHLFQKPPGWFFHAPLVPVAVWLLYAFSFPGFDFLAAAFAVALLGGASLVWLLRVGTFLWAVHKRTARGSWRWLLVAPLAGGVVLGIAWTDLPLRIRWELAKDDFERAARVAPPPTDVDEWVRFDVPRRIGSYRVVQAHRVGDAVIFYDSKGSFLNDAGFAYLPTGPFEELNTGWFEGPEFRSLGGDWYAWTASWCARTLPSHRSRAPDQPRRHEPRRTAAAVARGHRRRPHRGSPCLASRTCRRRRSVPHPPQENPAS